MWYSNGKACLRHILIIQNLLGSNVKLERYETMVDILIPSIIKNEKIYICFNLIIFQ